MSSERSVTTGRSGVFAWIEGDGLSPRQVPKAWVQGLRNAGVASAGIAKVRRSGGWDTLSLVVQFDCPFDHVDDDGEHWAKVRLKVNPHSGWVSLHEDSCHRCTVQRVEEWLITCPRCAGGVALEEHPEHAAFFYDEGDDAPLAFVLDAMNRLLFPTLYGSAPEPERAAWTVESAVEWMEKLMHEDGSHVVPPTMGQSASWEVVRAIPGHPPQAAVREAQAARKRAATKPPDS